MFTLWCCISMTIMIFWDNAMRQTWQSSIMPHFGDFQKFYLMQPPSPLHPLLTLPTSWMLGMSKQIYLNNPSSFTGQPCSASGVCQSKWGELLWRMLGLKRSRQSKRSCNHPCKCQESHKWDFEEPHEAVLMLKLIRVSQTMIKFC